ncbi:MAG: Uma2 family endonuclease [Xenococcaceae cyanobacterium]
MTPITNPTRKPQIIWEKLPEDFVLPDKPVENITQPFLAAALTEALDLAGSIAPGMLIASNMGICAKVDGKTVLKAPDWFYVPRVLPVGEGVIRRSYTPHTEGDIPAIVMEFLSETDTGEYSIRPTYPYGKMWFYERIVQVPLYVTFDPSSGMLEVRQLKSGAYEIQAPDAQGHYWIDSIGLSLGVWYGKRLEITTYWLRWWDKEGNLLLWGSEQVAQERQQTERERQRAESAEQEVAKLREMLGKAGISEEEDVD